MKRQHGAAVVEFALVSIVFLMLLLGMIEFGRALFKWNTAVDATRRGARTAAIAAVGDTARVLAEMQLIMPELTADELQIEYSSTGNFPSAACVRGTCRFVRVSVRYEFNTALFFVPTAITMPTFSTTLPVEALGAT